MRCEHNASCHSIAGQLIIGCIRHIMSLLCKKRGNSILLVYLEGLLQDLSSTAPSEAALSNSLTGQGS